MRYLVTFAEALRILIAVATIAATPLYSFGADLCQHVLKQKPSVQAIESTISALAKMKLTLDIAQSSGPLDIQGRALSKEYEIKKAQLLLELKISKKELQEKLTLKIAALQKRQLEETKKEASIRETQVRNLKLFTLKQSHELPEDTPERFGYSYLNKDHTRLTTISGGYFRIFSTVTGAELKEITFDHNYMPIPKMDLFLGVHGDKFSFFDPNTLKSQEIVFDTGSKTPVDLKKLEMTLSQDQNSVFFYDKNNFYVFDLSTKKLTSSGDFSTLNAGSPFRVELLHDNSMIIYTNHKIARYWPQTKKHLEFAGNSRNRAYRSMLSPDKSEIIFSVSEALIVHNLKTAKTRFQTFENTISQVFFGALPETLWVETIDSKVHLLNALDLSFDPKNDIDWNETVHYHDLTNLPFISVHSGDYSINSSPTGLYMRDNLTDKISTFEDRYDESHDLTVVNQAISEDGSVITNIASSKSTGKMHIETWEMNK